MNKIEYQSVKNNTDYMMCHLKSQLSSLLLKTSVNIPEDIRKEIRNMNEKAIEYELKTGEFVSIVVFRKDSILGQFMEEDKYGIFQNMDFEITYNKLVGALKRAMDKNEMQLINVSLLPLFMSESEKEFQELLCDSGDVVKNFILESDNITDYIDKIDNRRIFYIVYEEGNFEKRDFSELSPKKMVKKAE